MPTSHFMHPLYYVYCITNRKLYRQCSQDAHHACGELVGGAVLELANKHEPVAARLAHQMLLNARDGRLVVSAQAANRTHQS